MKPVTTGNLQEDLLMVWAISIPRLSWRAVHLLPAPQKQPAFCFGLINTIGFPYIIRPAISTPYFWGGKTWRLVGVEGVGWLVEAGHWGLPIPSIFDKNPWMIFYAWWEPKKSDPALERKEHHPNIPWKPRIFSRCSFWRKQSVHPSGSWSIIFGRLDTIGFLTEAAPKHQYFLKCFDTHSMFQ